MKKDEKHEKCEEKCENIKKSHLTTQARFRDAAIPATRWPHPVMKELLSDQPLGVLRKPIRAVKHALNHRL